MSPASLPGAPDSFRRPILLGHGRPRTLSPLATGLLALGCSGPQIHVDNPDANRVFVDGVETRAEELPFRYYGTVRWDALPVEAGEGLPTFATGPGSGAVRIEAPANGLLFPFDLAIELADRLWHGRRDVTIEPAVEPRPVAGDISPAALGELSERARAARLVR